MQLHAQLHQNGLLNTFRIEDPADLTVSLLQCLVLTAQSPHLPMSGELGGQSDRKNDAPGVIGSASQTKGGFTKV